MSLGTAREKEERETDRDSLFDQNYFKSQVARQQGRLYNSMPKAKDLAHTWTSFLLTI